ncbi:MAG: NfeD family protein [bacterium]
MKLWYIWITVSIVLFILETVVPTFVSFSLGIGCLIAGLISFLSVGLKGEIIAFAVTSLTVFFGLKPLFSKFLYYKREEVKTNIDALIGKVGIVSETIIPDSNKGRVIVGGEDWKAVSEDEEIVEVGQKIIVTRVEGVKLFVKLKSKEKEK